jgi:hypothetical protein
MWILVWTFYIWNLLNRIPTLSSLAKNYTEMEHDKIRGACTLWVADYNVYVSLIFAEILTQGWRVEKVQAVLQVCLKPDQNTDHPVYIHVSLDMAQDIKELQFGYRGDKDYASCHRGISSFAVVSASAETASAHRRAQDRLSRVSHLTSADVRDLVTSPGLCQTTYDAYHRGYCAHCLEVVAIWHTLPGSCGLYSVMPETSSQSRLLVMNSQNQCYCQQGCGCIRIGHNPEMKFI